MSNIVAGIGRGQMEVLRLRVEQRRENNKKYRKFFSNFSGISFQNEPNTDFYSNYWLTAILIDSKKTNGITSEDIRNAFELENIESRPLWKPMHIQPVYHGTNFFGSGNCEKLFENGLCLPSGSNLTADDFNRIFEVLNKVLNK
jgi:dTDP-4-amino-4,6-dideoxygalactose transaminase